LIRGFGAALWLGLAGPAAADDVPSGQAVVLWQVLWERVDGVGTQAILRFIAPGIAGGAVDFETAQADMDWLCATHGVPLAELRYAQSDVVVVTLMDRAVPRGRTDPDATQLFATYRIEAGTCRPEAF
jgi:hypothetical protein